jgi:hypothetical protein
MTDKYDRNGKPLELMEWAKLMENTEYKIVAQNQLANGKFVSTVWLGLDHDFTMKGPPLIFETMVFPERGDFHELDVRRYSTETEAKQGHVRMVKKWAK